MNPGLWPRNPEEVSQEFDKRHGGPGSTPDTFMWAVWAAEGSDYLEKLDDAAFTGGGTWPVDPHTGLVDISHVRWATGNAITAIDLCAATIGHLRCPRQDGKELSLRDFDQAQYARKRRRCRLTRREWRQRRQRRDVARRRASLTPEILSWVEDTLADPDYKFLLRARNPLTHSSLQRNLFTGTDAPRGHTDRTQFPVRKEKVNSRELVEKSAEVALDRVRAFVDVVDQY